MTVGTVFGVEGRLETSDGRIFTGQIRFRTNAALIANPEREYLATVALTNIRHLQFTPAAPEKTAPIAARTPAWIHADLGVSPLPGSSDTRPHQVRLRGGGLGIGGREDSCRFVYLPWLEAGEISARLLERSRPPTPAQPGLMMRESTDPGARQVFLGWSTQGGVFQWRPTARGPVEQASLPGLSRWIRLKRDGNTFLAYTSTEGRSWRLAHRIELELPSSLLTGCALASPPSTVPASEPHAQATFDQVRLGRGLRYHHFVPRLTLAGGSQLIEEIAFANAEGIHLAGTAPLPVISWNRMARLELQWVPSRWLSLLREGRSGALLRNGEFFEGEPKRLDSGTLVFSTVLLGLRRYDADQDVLAVVLRPARPRSASAEVHTWSGSVFRGDILALQEGGVLLLEPDLGRLRLPYHALKSVARR